MISVPRWICESCRAPIGSNMGWRPFVLTSVKINRGNDTKTNDPWTVWRECLQLHLTDDTDKLPHSSITLPLETLNVCYYIMSLPVLPHSSSPMPDLSFLSVYRPTASQKQRFVMPYHFWIAVAGAFVGDACGFPAFLCLPECELCLTDSVPQSALWKRASVCHHCSPPAPHIAF